MGLPVFHPLYNGYTEYFKGKVIATATPVGVTLRYVNDTHC